MSVYYRAIVQTDPCRPGDALAVAGGWTWFNRVERIERGQVSQILPIAEVPEETLERITSSQSA